MGNLLFSVPTNDSLLMPHVNIMSGHQHQYWHRAPSSGPNRHQHGRRFLCRTEPQPSYNRTRESSGTIEGDRSTGIRPCHAWIAGANFNTVVGEIPIKPYHRYRPNRSWKTRSDELDSSTYEIRIKKRHDGRGSEDSDSFAITLIGSTDSDVINKPCQECASTGPGTRRRPQQHVRG